MSAPLEAYLRQQRMGAMFGHPVVDEMNGPAAMWWMMQRRRGQGGRMGDDELAALMGGADELGAEAMAELGAALADDDDDDDDDDDEMLGASTEGLQDKLDKLKEKRAEAYGKYVSARFGPTRKIREKKLKRLDKKIAKVKAKLSKRKAENAAARGQAPGQPPGLARSQAPQGGDGPLENVMIQDSQGRYVGIQRAGRLQPLSLYVGGQLDATGNFPVSSVARSRVAASFQTDQITYASFFLRGFRVGAQMNPNTALTGSYSQLNCPMDCQLRIVVTNLTVNGFTNLLYSPITVELGSTFGFSSNREVIEGLRSNSRLSQNNRISADVYVENPFALSATNRIDFSLTFEALVDTEFDDLYGAYPARSAA